MLAERRRELTQPAKDNSSAAEGSAGETALSTRCSGFPVGTERKIITGRHLTGTPGEDAVNSYLGWKR